MRLPNQELFTVDLVTDDEQDQLPDILLIALVLILTLFAPTQGTVVETTETKVTSAGATQLLLVEPATLTMENRSLILTQHGNTWSLPTDAQSAATELELDTKEPANPILYITEPDNKVSVIDYLEAVSSLSRAGVSVEVVANDKLSP